MKHTIARAALALGLCTCVEPVFAVNYLTNPTDNANAIMAKKKLYTYLIGRRAASTNKMVEGQHLGGINQVYNWDVPDSFYGTFDYDRYDIDGKYPGLVGSRYDDKDKEVEKVQSSGYYILDAAICSAINQKLIEVWNDAQAIIHITATPPNPWDRDKGRYPDDSPNQSIGQLLHTASPSGVDLAAKNVFWEDIDIIAGGLLELQAAGIPVVFRPFAEFNMPSKYYWMDQTSTDFKALWADVYDRLVNYHGLHNLLFCWEAWVLNRDADSSDIANWYPPDSQVDLVGGSYYFVYTKTYVDGSGVFRLPAYDGDANQYDDDVHAFLISKNRPFAATQWGLVQNADQGQPGYPDANGFYGDHDFTLAFMDFCPDTSFVYYWNQYQAVDKQRHWSEFVADSVVATVDELPGFSMMTFTSLGGEDGWILELNSSVGTGGWTNSNDSNYPLKVGDDTGKKQVKSIVSFNTAALPDDADVTVATLKLKRKSLAANAYGLGALKVDIKTGNFYGDVALTVEDFSNATGQAPANVVDIVAGGMSAPANDGDFSTGSLNPNGRAAIKLNGRTQFRMYFSTDSNNDGVADYLTLYSGDDTTTANRPLLEVTYR